MQGRPVQPIADKPLGVIDLLDGAFAALRQRARTLTLIVAGMVIPVSLFQGWVTRDDLGGATFGDLVNDPTVANEVSQTTNPYDTGFFIAQILAMLVAGVAGVSVSRVVYGWFEGREVTAADALLYTARRSGAILAAFVLVHLIEAIGFLLLVIPGFIAIVLCSLTSPVLAVEEVGPVAAIRRSWSLVRRRPAPVVGVMFFYVLVAYLTSQAVGTMPQFAALFIGPDRAWPLVSAAALATQVILVPVNGAAMCLLYLDIRFRSEGLDLHRRMYTEFGAAADPAMDPEATA